MRPAIVATAAAAVLFVRSGVTWACPACDEPGGIHQGVDPVIALLIGVSLLLVIRELVRRLLRRLGRRRPHTLPSTESNTSSSP